MRNFGSTLKWYWLIWIVLILLILGFGSLAFGEFRRWRALTEDIGQTEQEILQTKERVEELSGEISLVTDPAYLEKEARRTLNVKREGEEVFIVAGLDNIRKDEHFSLASAKEVEETVQVWENMKAWWKYFFN